MTGRELIIYILENHLDDEQVFKDGHFLDFITEEEAAVKYGVGPATIRAWVNYGWLIGYEIENELYIPKKAKLTFENVKNKKE